MLGSGIQIALGPFKFLYPFMDPEWPKSCKVTHQFADKHVEMALRNRHNVGKNGSQLEKEAAVTPKPYVLLHWMAEQTGDKTELRNEILQAMMAAQGTTAALISNVFSLVSRNKLTWKQLHEEIIALGPVNLDQGTLQSMKYLRNVLNESAFSCSVFALVPQSNL